jgi:type I restriction enzyme S subunit
MMAKLMRNPLDDKRELPALPRGWAWIKLGDLTAAERNAITDGPFGSKLKTEHYTDAGPRVIRLQNIGEGLFQDAEAHISDKHFRSLEKHQVFAGDLVIAALGVVLPRACIIPSGLGPAIVKADCIRFKPNSELGLPSYLCLALNSQVVQRRTATTVHGVGRPRLNLKEIKAIPLPLAPVAEQQRIVDRALGLLTNLDAAVNAMKCASAKLNTYRSAVLKAAIEGKLTEAWRAKHKDVEPASELWRRVLAEHRKKWEVEQRARFKAAGKEPPKNWQGKYPEPYRLDLATLPNLPTGWCWGRVSDVGNVQLGRQRSPAHHRGEHMRPYLRVANVYEDRIDTTDVMSMNFTPAEYESYRLEFGDILLNEGQSLEWVGRPAMYRGEVPGSCFQNTLVRFRALPSVLPLFALYVFRAYLHSKRFQKVARWTVNIAHLGADRFSQIEFPIPPIAEQKQIVAEIEARLTVVSKLEVHIAANLNRAGRLRQSILKRAFEGKLVAQDASDEPIAAVLARIQKDAKNSAPSVVQQPAGGPKRPRHSRETFYRRGSLVTYIIQQLADDATFGRTKLEKVLYLAQTHLEIPLALEFERQAAGPFDKLIYKLEGTARKQGWFLTKKRRPNAKPGDRFKDSVTYQPGTSGQPLIDHATQVLGDKRDGLDNMLGHMKKLNTDETELLATVYAAWNDLLLEAKSAELDDIVREVHGWHTSKKRFTPMQIETRIAWMRKFGYVPSGRGQRTTLLDRKSKVPPRRKGRRV